jgi:radical SAM protein with 4Fe4S-binding SPASM domain
MCYRHSWDNILGDMDKETIDKLYKQIDNSITIVFGGIGEPTVAKNFEYAVEKFKDFKLEITTNGIMNEENLLLVCKNFDNVIISVDGTEADYYDIRKTDFNDVKRTIEFIYNYRKQFDTKLPQMEFAFVISKVNKDAIYNVIDCASKFDVKKILMSHLLPQNLEQQNEICYTEYYNELGHEYVKLVNKYAYFGMRVVVSFPFMEIKTDRECHFIENDYTYIDYSGEVSPCYRFSNTYKELVFGREKIVLKHSFGNILNNSITDIYNNKKYKLFRNSVIHNDHPSCVDCDLRDGCSYIEDTEFDCLGNSPSCGDCLWNRNIIRCT